MLDLQVAVLLAGRNPVERAAIAVEMMKESTIKKALEGRLGGNLLKPVGA